MSIFRSEFQGLSFLKTVSEAEMTRKYRPANGSEGEGFMEQFCYRCKHDNYPDGPESEWCQILANSMCFEIDEPGYPDEWIYGEDGQPKCTAFERQK